MKMSNEKMPHIPIMVGEMLNFFKDVKIRTFFDGTLGAGGHAKAILEAHPEIEKYIGCDKDPEAWAIARNNLAPWAKKVEFVQGDFGRLDEYLKERKIDEVDGFFLTSGCHLCN
jgi:16S rRNA (cytosine1402-N4)-methyltransferase